MTVVIGRTHAPCGACGALIDLTDRCKHLGRSSRADRRERERAARMVDRAELLAALGYPRP